MALHRRAAKRDASEPAIVDALQRLGWSVLRVSVTNGPDLFASKQLKRNVTVAIEVKTGTKSLRPGQAHWVENWQGRVHLLRTPEDVIKMDTEYRQLW